ncbi:MAG TPA: DUF938 domain-containing protein [Rhodocyclaceae bacterium]|jgi:cyclopropane fatty-acyl-phospholipid synthase-like methyltransferase|nr:DUF938 domain-containing protein [Rhodocyclaceae bacterium]
MSDKPFSPSCERNRDFILPVLREHFADCRRVIEIGSGTGQHAIHFAAALPYLIWQTSECEEHLPGMRLWLDEAALPNVPVPLLLNVNDAWPQQKFDAAFTANTLHIMAWPEVERFFAQLSQVLERDSRLVIYGPFNYGGYFTSESNAAFDVWLKRDGAHRGIRDIEAVNALAEQAGFQLLEDVEMPANNRCLIFVHA